MASSRLDCVVLPPAAVRRLLLNEHTGNFVIAKETSLSVALKEAAADSSDGRALRSCAASAGSYSLDATTKYLSLASRDLPADMQSSTTACNLGAKTEMDLIP